MNMLIKAGETRGPTTETNINDAEIIASFEMIDDNSDGRISKVELIKGVELLGMNPTEEYPQVMMGLADLDGDGFIDFEEYKNMIRHNYIETDFDSAFRNIDKSKDGYLSVDELRSALTYTAPPETKLNVELCMEEGDVNKDGKIDYTEFVNSQLCTKIFT